MKAQRRETTAMIVLWILPESKRKLSGEDVGNGNPQLL
jgi:hypothetical protein